MVETLGERLVQDSAVIYSCDYDLQEQEGGTFHAIGGCIVSCREDVTEGLSNQISGHASYLFSFGGRKG